MSCPECKQKGVHKMSCSKLHPFVKERPLKKNSAKCDHCGVEIESKHRHDFISHRCTTAAGSINVFSVDGGLDYVRRVGRGYTDTSEYE